MDRTESAPKGPDLRSPKHAGGLDLRSAKSGGGSQSKLSPVLFWVVLAAIVFRVVTVATERNRKDKSGGLIQWQPHEAALAVAGKTGKPVLYDFTAAWCAPCHRLDKEAWGDSTIASSVNQGFVPARVMDRQEEDGHNSPAVDELQKRYKINAFPTLVVADSTGRELARSEGFQGLPAVNRLLEEGRRAAAPPAAKP